MPTKYKQKPNAKRIRYRADFLFGYRLGSIEEAGYEFANARTEEYRQEWWGILKKRLRKKPSEDQPCR